MSYFLEDYEESDRMKIEDTSKKKMLRDPYNFNNFHTRKHAQNSTSFNMQLNRCYECEDQLAVAGMS